ncbi:MAG: ABC transporter permease [Lachnospiraceae bacterium]|nr:ABC transporter permease [Lachnospiraceae bacterium]
MAKYILRRVLHGIFSIVVVVGIVMVLIYSLLSRDQIFATDPNFIKVAANRKITYKYEKWEEFGYLDYVNYTDWLTDLVTNGELAAEARSKLTNLGKDAESDKENVAEYVKKFTDYYESKGYTVTRLKTVMAGKKVTNGGQPQLFAAKDIPVLMRLLTYFGNLFQVDTVNSAKNYEGERKITFTLYDPLYGGQKFSPAIMGQGTFHKYLLYFDNEFPYIHQNLLSVNLGVSYSVNQGVEVVTTMTKAQGSYVQRMTTYPTGLTEMSADDLHSATYMAGSRDSIQLRKDRFLDDYTTTITFKSGMSRIGYSFVIGLCSVLLTYLIGVPMAIWMAQKKDKAVDKIGSVYVVFITAMPSLAYIFLVKAIGNKIGIPTTFNIEEFSWTMCVLPIISLSLRPIGSMMRWLRRYMVDQQNADYVKFARSGGLSEREIFTRHILKNASIPIIYGIPGSILFSMTGALVTERVYTVPGIGGIFINAINAYDNGVIVGVALFYAVLSVVSGILGDIMMSIVDPRISFSSKAR